MERIICAAIWFPDMPTPIHTVTNVEGLVLCGYRHGHIFGQLDSLLSEKYFKTESLKKEVQGFLTSERRFVDRKEAREIHLASGGTSEFDDELYSEDLY
jgi:hypothetical protein